MAARRRRDNALFAVLAVLAVLGGGHTVLGWFKSPPPGPSDSATATIVAHAELAKSFAEEFVVTYLSASAGQQDRLAEFIGDARQITLPSTGRQVTDPMAVYTSRDIGQPAVDVWAVTVSVKVAKSGAGGGVREYYRVPVSVTPDGRRRAVALPAAVVAPGRGNDLVENYVTTCTKDSPLAQVASGFLAAYLTGSGDVGRYTTVNSGLAALRPAPFTAAETVTVSSEESSCGTGGTSARVLATVDPKSGSSATPTLAYPLTMIRNAGQWQVQSVDSLPALRNPLAIVSGDATRDSAEPSASTTPSTAASIPPATQN